MRKNKAFSLIELSAVIIIIGIVIAGVVAGSIMVSKFRLSAAENLSRSSPILGIKDNALWLETSLTGSINESQANDGSTVTSWYDQNRSSTKALVVAVGTGATYANTINSVHAIKFTGSTSNYLQVSDASFLNNTDYTIFVLEKRQSSASNNYFIGETSGSPNTSLALGYSTDSTILHGQGNQSYTTNATVSSYASSADNPRQFTFVHSSSAGNSTYINGVLAAQDATKTSHLTGITTLAIGKGYTGEIGEIVIFTRALKAEERQSIEDYSAKKWNSSNNRNSVAGGTCLGYTVTNNGCDLSSATCSINITGLVATVSATSSSTPLSCNQSPYSGSVNYTCINGTPNVTGSCTIATPCTGGSVNTTIVPGTTIHTFTTNDSFVCTGAKTASILVVGGGGGGGGNGGGGGGGGGVVFKSSFNIPAGTYSALIGGGGPGTYNIVTSNGSGQSSSINISGVEAAVGGGGGASRDGGGNGATGGSGGGGGGGQVGGGSGTSGQGSAGGGGFNNGCNSSGGGGGGGGGSGTAGINLIGGTGGAGYTSLISGTSAVYASGGGGGRTCNSGGSAGTGGTGAGNGTITGAGTNATGYGSGGGGGGAGAGGGSGRPGIIIISYPTP